MISSILDCTEGTQADTAVRRWSSNALRGAEAAARLLLHFARAASESRKFLLHIAVSAFGSLRRGGSYWPVLSASHCTHGRLSFHCARTDSANFYVSLLSVRPSLRCARLFLTMLSRADNVFKIDFIEFSIRDLDMPKGSSEIFAVRQSEPLPACVSIPDDVEVRSVSCVYCVFFSFQFFSVLGS